MADETPTDANDFGLGIGDPRDGEGVDHSSLEYKPGITPSPHSGLPDGSDPETFRRNGPDGDNRQVNHPRRERTTPTIPPARPQDTTHSMSELPGEDQYSEHEEYYNLGDSSMLTVEDISRPKKDQPSDPWPDWDTHLSSRIRHLAASIRSSNA